MSRVEIRGWVEIEKDSINTDVSSRMELFRERRTRFRRGRSSEDGRKIVDLIASLSTSEADIRTL